MTTAEKTRLQEGVHDLEREALAEDARAARGRALSVTAPLLLASLCMLALGPALVRAMALPMLSGALSALVSATGLTGRLWARLYRPGK